ncbi:hypothetical protein [Undibacterium sp.]|uniref:hypothetical protein n=1 Tax=Undibacterium sp. TaxID=1914977 RepID=UPI003751EAF0
MPRTVTQLIDLGVYRDGGSLCVSFKTAEPAIEEYTLIFPINGSPAFDSTLKNATFKSPLLEIYKVGQYVSPVTGISTPNTTKEATSISWAEACILLDNIRPYLFDFQSEYLWVFEAMPSVATTEGNPC